MLCAACNQEIADNAKFCRHCGATVSSSIASPAIKKCPQCGAENAITAKFCRADGFRFDGAQATKGARTAFGTLLWSISSVVAAVAIGMGGYLYLARPVSETPAGKSPIAFPTSTVQDSSGSYSFGTLNGVQQLGSPIMSGALTGTSVVRFNYVDFTGFGFNVPSNATINGVLVEINRHGSQNSTNRYIQDNTVQLVKGGTAQGNNEADTITKWDNTQYLTIPYGGANDLWGLSLTPVDVNSSNFGVRFTAQGRDQDFSNTTSADIDWIRVKVYYTKPFPTSGSPSSAESSVSQEIPDVQQPERRAAEEVRSASQEASALVGEFVDIPGGTFQMGCSPGDSECDDNERPVHTVSIKPFRMGKYEVTIGQFRRFVEAAGYRTDAERSGNCIDKAARGKPDGARQGLAQPRIPANGAGPRSVCELERRRGVCSMAVTAGSRALPSALRERMGIRGAGRWKQAL